MAGLQAFETLASSIKSSADAAEADKPEDNGKSTVRLFRLSASAITREVAIRVNATLPTIDQSLW